MRGRSATAKPLATSSARNPAVANVNFDARSDDEKERSLSQRPRPRPINKQAVQAQRIAKQPPVKAVPLMKTVAQKSVHNYLPSSDFDAFTATPSAIKVFTVYFVIAIATHESRA
jgi:hypothetical protein